MQLTCSGFSNDCSPVVTSDSSRATPRTISLAGAFHTPRTASVRAHTPATCPDGGTVMNRSPLVEPLVAKGFATTRCG